MIQFQIVLGMIPKVEITRHTSELQSEFDNSVLQVAEKKGLQHRCFPMIIAKFKDTYFEKHLRTPASENLSRAASLTFRRYFRSSSLSAF